MAPSGRFYLAVSDDRADGTFTSSCSRTSSSVDSDRTSNEENDHRLHPPLSPNNYQQQPLSSEWSEGSDDPSAFSPRSASYPLPYSSQSSTADSETPSGSPPPGPGSRSRPFDVFDLPSALDAAHRPSSAGKHSRRAFKPTG